MNRLGQLPGGLRGNWGYSDTLSGREFALNCKWSALDVVDVTDPTNPFIVSTVPSLGIDLKEVKTYRQYAYAVNQSGPIQIIDLSNPDSAYTAATFQNSNIDGAHTIFIEGDYAYLGMNGAGTRDLRILDISNPLLPLEVGSWTHPDQGGPGLVESHDNFVRNDTCFIAYLDGGVPILDVSDKTNPQILNILQYPGNFTHNVWTTEDGNYLLTTDEVVDGHLRIWDIQNLSNIQEVGSYFPEPNRVIHNVHVLGDFAYMSYYGNGVRVVDISIPTEPAEVGFYDTVGSTWGVYPYAPSGSLYGSDLVEGLLVLEFNGTRAGWIQGTVTDALSGDSIPGARIQLIAGGVRTLSDSSGFYSLRYAAGNFNPITRAFGYYDDTSATTIVQDSTTIHNINLTPLPTGTISGRIQDGNTTQGLNSTLHLYINGILYQTTTTDTSGNYIFSNLWITYPPDVDYDRMDVLPPLPYADTFHMGGIVVVAGSPTIVNFDRLPREIIIIDDDEGATYESYYTSASESLGISWVTWDVNQKGGFHINKQDILSRPMIWFTGNSVTNTLTPGDQESLKVFIDNGGKLFLTGQNIGEEINGSSFFTNTLRSSFVNGTTSDHILNGVPGDPIGNGISIITVGSGGAGNQYSQDMIAPLSGAFPVFQYSTDSVSAIRVDTLGECRVVYFAFGFEAINELGVYAGRDEVLSRILTCLGYPVGIEERSVIELHSTRFTLFQNSPNPFSQNTTFRYQLPEQGNVSFKIYDITGRLVRTLVEERQKQGSYYIIWNGLNAERKQVPSGVYFYRLQAGDFTASKKMIMSLSKSPSPRTK